MFKRLKMPVLLFVVLLFALTPAIASDEKLTLRWDKGPEVDIQSYNLYLDTNEDAVKNMTVDPIETHSPSEDILEKLGDDGKLSYESNFVAPDGEDTTFYFGVTAVDTAGNESGISNIYSKKYDFLAPAPPTGLSGD